MNTVLVLAFAISLATETNASQGTLSVCDAAALAAAETHGIPTQVMLAITRVETGRKMDGSLVPWPWAVNQAGEPHWFETLQQAEVYVNDALLAGYSNIDIGCFQLNYRWHGEQFTSLQAMFDPFKNADYAARFLRENHRQKGNWVDAVAVYHSQTRVNAEAYIKKVETVLAMLQTTGNPDKPSPLAEPQIARVNRFPLLVPGQNNALASLVPRGQALSPLFGARP